MGVLRRRGWRVPVLLVLALGLLLLQAVPAGAVFRPGRPPGPPPRLRNNTELTLTRLGPGQGVTGFIADLNSPFDPVRDGYPPSNPSTGWTEQNESFAGIIHAAPSGGGAELSLYCIDIRTLTWVGVGYVLGTWDSSNVPNVGYVARLLDEYYPNTGEPALGNVNATAAAVQAAIWFFTDKYVLNTGDPLYATVVGIVNRIRSEGPLVQPPPPSLTITPSSKVGAAGRKLGPFTLTTTHSPATVTATGATMYSDRAATTLLGNGTTASVDSGTKIWLRPSSSGPSTAVLQATSEATVPSGNVYLYDGNWPDVTDAQHLILAQTATLKTTVQATAEFKPFGSLTVKKTIAGPAAGSQGPVVIQVSCTNGRKFKPITIPAGAHAGSKSRTYHYIVAGTVCTITETANGSTATVKVTVSGDGSEATIPAGGNETLHITDTYEFVPGSLIVRKTIAGPAAGKQGEIRIHTVCDGKALTPDFVILADKPAGDYTQRYDDIPAGAKCTVTETANGHTSSVTVVVEGSGQTVTVPPGDIVEADVSDTYGLAPGELEVTKTIAGPAAGQQGSITIHTVCNGTALTPDFIIAANAPAGVQSHLYTGIATPAKCTVTETVNGHTSTVSVIVTGSPHDVTVPAGGAGAATITDTYGNVPGSLLVTKTIAGPQAGHQGPVTIHVVCNGTALSPDFVIDAHTPAGTVSHTFDGIPAGSVCTVTETADGSSATVIATVSGSGQTATVPAGKVTAVSLTDVYDEGSPALEGAGTLTVIKHIAGSAAHLHGRIAILVACGGPLYNFAFIIPAHTGAGSVTRHFSIPSGSRCTVSEVAVGRTSKVSVVAIGQRQQVTIPATGSATVRVTDRFRRVVVVPTPRVTG